MQMPQARERRWPLRVIELFTAVTCIMDLFIARGDFTNFYQLQRMRGIKCARGVVRAMKTYDPTHGVSNVCLLSNFCVMDAIHKCCFKVLSKNFPENVYTSI